MLLLIAIVFWAWALVNTIWYHFDLGVVSFMWPALAAAIVLRSPQLADTHSSRRRRTWMLTLSPLLPSANYILGVVIVCQKNGMGWLTVYMVTGAVWWMVAGAIGYICSEHRSGEIERQFEV